MALQEETLVDQGTGRIVNTNVAEYLMPVNADVPPIETIFAHDAPPRTKLESNTVILKPDFSCNLCRFAKLKQTVANSCLPVNE